MNQKPRLPGSPRMRSNAAKRIANWIRDDTWHVVGGDNPHVVIAGTYNKPETFKCDCSVSASRADHLCCHILAVMREM